MSQTTSQQNLPGLSAETNPPLAPGEIILGQLKDLDARGNPLVDFDCNPDDHAQVAVSTLAVTRHHLGRQVAILFASGDLRRPVIMGFIHNPLEELLQTYADVEQRKVEVKDESALSLDSPAEIGEEVKIDGRKLVIEGREEIVLKCGESSITLHKSGKIVLKGKYLLSRASGVNRILGGSVQVN